MHRHLEGSIRAETLLEIAERFHVPVPFADGGRFRRWVQVTPQDPRTFGNFQLKFQAIRPFWVHREAIELAARRCIRDAAREGIVYLELRMHPGFFCLERGFDPWDVASWIVSAARAESRKARMTVRFIACLVRHLGGKVNAPLARMLFETDWFSGIDVAGAETAGDLGCFTELYERARDRGLGLTVHAGEQWGTEINVRHALDRLGVRRMGHALCALRRPALLRRLQERGVTIESCLTSNLRTGLVSTLEAHPIRNAAPANITINTDDPAVFGTTLPEEVRTAEELGLRPDLLTRNALKAAFLSPGERKALRKNPGIRAALGPLK